MCRPTPSGEIRSPASPPAARAATGHAAALTRGVMNSRCLMVSPLRHSASYPLVRTSALLCITGAVMNQACNIKTKATKQKQYDPGSEQDESSHDSNHSCDIDQTADDDMPICYYRPPANAPGRRAPLISVYTTTLPLKLGTTSATYG